MGFKASNINDFSIEHGDSVIQNDDHLNIYIYTFKYVDMYRHT